MSYPLSIVTPEGKVYENTVDSIFASGLHGGFEVYTNHQPALMALTDGELRVRKDGKESIYKCSSGILEVRTDHKVLVLVDAVK